MSTPAGLPGTGCKLQLPLRIRCQLPPLPGQRARRLHQLGRRALGHHLRTSNTTSGLRSLRGFRLAGIVEGDRLANERLEGGLVDVFSFVDVDRASYDSVEARVEETGRILQRRAPGEGQLHDSLVGFASTE